MKIYKLIDSFVSADLPKDTENIWLPFQVQENMGIAPEIQIEWPKSPLLFYTVEVLRPEYKDHILKYDRSILFADSTWTKAALYADTSEAADSLLILMLYSYLVTRQTLLMHSSLVDFQGSGIMFLGPSGIGKTTQAELWNQYTGADILNGDMVFIREREDGFYGYGSPWHGSSPYYRNAKVKLKALVTLEQAPENTLRRLSGFEVMQEIMNQVFLPHWYQEAMDACLNTLDAVLTQVPVYHLACRPDEGAVQLLKNELDKI